MHHKSSCYEGIEGIIRVAEGYLKIAEGYLKIAEDMFTVRKRYI